MATGLSDGILHRVSILETRVATIEGKDMRDYDLLNKIEKRLDDVSGKIDQIQIDMSKKEGVKTYKGKAVFVVYSLLMFFAAIIGGSDNFLRHIGIT